MVQNHEEVALDGLDRLAMRGIDGVRVAVRVTRARCPMPDARCDAALRTSFVVREFRPLEFETASLEARSRSGLTVSVTARDLTPIPLARGHVSWRIERTGYSPAAEEVGRFPDVAFESDSIDGGWGEVDRGTALRRRRLQGRRNRRRRAPAW